MPTPKYHGQLKTLVEETDHWTILDEHHFRSHGGANREPQTVSDKDLAQLHPLYPTALRGLIELAYEPAIDTEVYANTAGYAAQWTLEYLLEPGVWIRSVGEETYLYQQIDEIYACTDNATQVMVCGLIFTVESLGPSYADMPVVITSSAAKLRVSLDYLNAMYPGWTSRWQIASELGLAYPALQKHAFGETPLTLTLGESVLTGLTFD